MIKIGLDDYARSFIYAFSVLYKCELDEHDVNDLVSFVVFTGNAYLPSSLKFAEELGRYMALNLEYQPCHISLNDFTTQFFKTAIATTN